MQVKEILLRLKKAFNVTSNEDISKILKISSPDLSGRIKRDTIPYKQILNALEDTDDDLRHIFFGKRENGNNSTPNVRYFNGNENECCEGSLNCGSDFELIHVDQKLLPSGGVICMYKISKETMGNTIKSGDTIIIDTTNQKISDGDIYIINLEGTIIIRRVFIFLDKLILKSDDKKYPQYELPADQVKIVGRVASKITQL